jgi:hypothetical protein
MATSFAGEEHLLTFNGETQNLKDWGRRVGIDRRTLRPSKEGLAGRQILTVPVQHQKARPTGPMCFLCGKQITRNVYRPINTYGRQVKTPLCLNCFLMPGTDEMVAARTRCIGGRGALRRRILHVGSGRVKKPARSRC